MLILIKRGREGSPEPYPQMYCQESGGPVCDDTSASRVPCLLPASGSAEPHVVCEWNGHIFSVPASKIAVWL
jgi:hypothetical protein